MIHCNHLRQSHSSVKGRYRFHLKALCSSQSRASLEDIFTFKEQRVRRKLRDRVERQDVLRSHVLLTLKSGPKVFPRVREWKLHKETFSWVYELVIAEVAKNN
jgi:hypothetical protein